MADLILNNPETDRNTYSEIEHDYEFDPNDSDAVKRIHVLLSLRKLHHIRYSEKLLSIVCDKTIDHTYDSASQPK